MKFTDRLFNENKELWESYLNHPFIKGMEKGCLDVEAFKYYMIQDYLYLKEYAKVFAIGISRTSDSDNVRQLSDSMNAITWETENVHTKYMERIGITEKMINNTEASLSNIGYTSYMIAKSYENDVINAFIAVLSCSWSYAYIGEKIMERSPHLAEDNVYGEWLRAYGSDEYQKSNLSLMDRVNELCKDLPEERLKDLCDIFRICSLFEERFWDMSYTMGRSDSLYEE